MQRPYNDQARELTQQLWTQTLRDFPQDAQDTLQRHSATIQAIEKIDLSVQLSDLLALMADCLEIYRDNPRERAL